MSGTEEKTLVSGPVQPAVMEPDEKDFTRQSLDRVFSKNRGGFFFLIASPRTQAAALERYAGGNVAVYDFGQAKDEDQGRHIIQILRLTEREPDRDVYVYQNFQLALWDSSARDGLGDWDIDAIHRLNYSRDQLNHLRKRMVFCMTREADDQLNRHAMDFYDFVRLFLRMEDEPEERPEQPTARPVDRSVGVDVKVDFSQDEETLLNQAIALGNQAWELYEAARYADALHLYEKQVEIRETVLGMDHPDTAWAYHDIGIVYCDLGDYGKALEYNQKALEIREKVLGPDHPDTAWSYNSLGMTYNSMDDYGKALEYNQKALAVREKVLGPDHPDTAQSYHNLGVTYDNMGEHRKALEYKQKALPVREKAWGPNHPVTAMNYDDLCVTYENMGYYGKALEYRQKSLMIAAEVLGSKHSYTITTYNNLADTYEAMGDTATAAQWRKIAESAQRERDAEQREDGHEAG